MEYYLAYACIGIFLYWLTWNTPQTRVHMERLVKDTWNGAMKDIFQKEQPNEKTIQTYRAWFMILFHGMSGVLLALAWPIVILIGIRTKE